MTKVLSRGGVCSSVYFLMGQPRPLFRLFSVFSNKEYNFTTNPKSIPNNNGPGGSPGQVVMGDDSCSRGRGVESQYWMDNFVIDLW